MEYYDYLLVDPDGNYYVTNSSSGQEAIKFAETITLGNSFNVVIRADTLEMLSVEVNIEDLR